MDSLSRSFSKPCAPCLSVSGNLVALCVITRASLDFKTSFLRLVDLLIFFIFFGGGGWGDSWNMNYIQHYVFASLTILCLIFSFLPIERWRPFPSSTASASSWIWSSSVDQHSVRPTGIRWMFLFRDGLKKKSLVVFFYWALQQPTPTHLLLPWVQTFGQIQIRILFGVLVSCRIILVCHVAIVSFYGSDVNES